MDSWKKLLEGTDLPQEPDTAMQTGGNMWGTGVLV